MARNHQSIESQTAQPIDYGGSVKAGFALDRLSVALQAGAAASWSSLISPLLSRALTSGEGPDRLGKYQQIHRGAVMPNVIKVVTQLDGRLLRSSCIALLNLRPARQTWPYQVPIGVAWNLPRERFYKSRLLRAGPDQAHLTS